MSLDIAAYLAKLSHRRPGHPDRRYRARRFRRRGGVPEGVGAVGLSARWLGPDGGALARFGPLAALFGIDTVNPTTAATSNGTGVPVVGTGVKLGAANVLPILVDATYEYQPLSDLASWPNAFTLVNNLAAGLSPTYMLRGLNLDLGGLSDQVLAGVTGAVDGIDPTDPNSTLAINLYLTLHSATLPMRIANAFAPALRILTDVGYSNVVRNPDGTYTRDFSQAGTESTTTADAGSPSEGSTADKAA